MKKSSDKKIEPQANLNKANVKTELAEDELNSVSGGNIGSQSTGAGAGKVTFNPFSITRKIDRSTP
jgi:type VI protein secretion system component Hcp